MAKGQLHGNREAKKPKQDKKPAPPTAGVPWTTPPKAAAVGKPDKKK
ncbi:MAG TPA: hypothetical protein VGC69_16840 [Bordetella sp.]